MEEEYSLQQWKRHWYWSRLLNKANFIEYKVRNCENWFKTWRPNLAINSKIYDCDMN